MRFLSFKPCFGASEVISTLISDILANKFHLGRLNFNTVASDIVSRIPCELFGNMALKKSYGILLHYCTFRLLAGIFGFEFRIFCGYDVL